MAFRQTANGTAILWRGTPDCEAAQKFVRRWLKTNSPVYPVVWVPENTRLQGNLGECIAFCCAQFAWNPLPRCIAANAFHSLANTSRIGIDLLWIGFGQRPQDDFV